MSAGEARNVANASQCSPALVKYNVVINCRKWHESVNSTDFSAKCDTRINVLMRFLLAQKQTNELKRRSQPSRRTTK